MWSHHFMANRWKTMETVTDFIFLGSTITGDCSHEFKTSKLSSWKESYDKPREYIKKERHHFADKHLYSQRYGFFPVVINGCVSWSWAIEKAEHQRIDVFKLWCCRRLLRVPWTARISNQAIRKDINLEYSLEVLMLKLKLQYFGHLMRKTESLENTLLLGKTEGRRRRGQQRMRWLDGLTNSMKVSLSKLQKSEGQGSLVCCSPWGSQRVGHK